MLKISSDQRRALRARAHSLNPVVAISHNGLSEAVVKEINSSLICHELIKIRVHEDERVVRERFLVTLCDCLQAAPVQHIGKMLVLWRPRPDQLAGVARPRPRRTEPRRSKRSFQGAAGG